MADVTDKATREIASPEGEPNPVDVMAAERILDLQARFRGAMAAVASSVAIVTSHYDGKPHGATVTAFASLSMEPPMVLVSLDRSSDLLKMIGKAGRFGLNILSTDQAALAMSFARKGVNKLAGVDWVLECDTPRLPAALGWLASEVCDTVVAGDHVVLIGLVKEVVNQAGKPLTYYLRSLGTHVSLPG